MRRRASASSLALAKGDERSREARRTRTFRLRGRGAVVPHTHLRRRKFTYYSGFIVDMLRWERGGWLYRRWSALAVVTAQLNGFSTWRCATGLRRECGGEIGFFLRSVIWLRVVTMAVTATPPNETSTIDVMPEWQSRTGAISIDVRDAIDGRLVRRNPSQLAQSRCTLAHWYGISGLKRVRQSGFAQIATN